MLNKKKYGIYFGDRIFKIAGLMEITSLKLRRIGSLYLVHIVCIRDRSPRWFSW